MAKVIVRIISMAIIIFIFFIIFSFSSENGSQSKGTSWKVAEKLIELQPKYKNITEEEKEKLIEEYQPFVRKGAHFSIYATLGISLTSFLCTYDIDNKKKLIFALWIGFIYAMSDEIHQTFVPGRSGQMTDVMLDSLGILLGNSITIMIYKLICNKTKTA